MSKGIFPEYYRRTWEPESDISDQQTEHASRLRIPILATAYPRWSYITGIVVRDDNTPDPGVMPDRYGDTPDDPVDFDSRRRARETSAAVERAEQQRQRLAESRAVHAQSCSTPASGVTTPKPPSTRACGPTTGWETASQNQPTTPEPSERP